MIKSSGDLEEIPAYFPMRGAAERNNATFRLDEPEQKENIYLIAESVVSRFGTIRNFASYPQVIPALPEKGRRNESLRIRAMIALVCTAVFVVAAAFAVVAILVTMQGRKAQIVALLAEYRSLRQDREFLVELTSHGSARATATCGSRAPRRPHRSNRPNAEMPAIKQLLRAAA